jgi:hypothetical protein
VRDQKLGMTPVFSAAETGHGDIVMSLIEQGADIHVAREYTFLHAFCLCLFACLLACSRAGWVRMAETV